MNAASLFQAYLTGGGIMGVVGYIVSYVYQYIQLPDCVRSPSWFGEPPIVCPSPDEGSALVTAAVFGLGGILVTFLLENNKN